MMNDLGFKITDDGLIELKEIKNSHNLPKLLTAHIDLMQIRNRQIYFLDNKLNTVKEKLIEQPTWRALAMCR